MKIPDYDFRTESPNQRDFNDDVRRIMNNGLLELKLIATSSPGWTEEVSGVPVISIYGGSLRLYISDTTATNGWHYVDFTPL